MNQRIIDKIRLEIQQLEVKNLFKINENGNKVKVRRNSENEYSIYHNGHFVTTDATWQAAFELVTELIYH